MDGLVLAPKARKACEACSVQNQRARFTDVCGAERVMVCFASAGCVHNGNGPQKLVRGIARLANSSYQRSSPLY